MKFGAMGRLLGAMLAVWVLSSIGAGLCAGQTPKAKSGVSLATSGEKNGDLQLEAARNNPLQLRQFLKKMPKGADLHYHLSGGGFAGSLLRAGGGEGLWVDRERL